MIDEKRLVARIEEIREQEEGYRARAQKKRHTLGMIAFEYARNGYQLLLQEIQRGDFNVPAGNAQAVKDEWSIFYRSVPDGILTGPLVALGEAISNLRVPDEKDTALLDWLEKNICVLKVRPADREILNLHPVATKLSLRAAINAAMEAANAKS